MLGLLPWVGAGVAARQDRGLRALIHQPRYDSLEILHLMLWAIRTSWLGSPESSSHVLCAQEVLKIPRVSDALSLLSLILEVLLARLEHFRSKVAAEVICSLNF